MTTAIATGVDIIEIDRFQAVLDRRGESLLRRIFTQGELEDTRGNTASLAVRFAAKEAVSKALGTGIGIVGWKEIEIRTGEANQPILQLHGKAAQIAQEKGLHQWSVSLSHSRSNAVAFVVAIT